MAKGINKPRIRDNKDNFCIFNMTWELTIINPKPEKLPKQKQKKIGKTANSIVDIRKILNDLFLYRFMISGYSITINSK